MLRESSSVGRASPCHGEGRGFEPRFSLCMSSIEHGTDYIRQCRSLGFSDAEIIQALQKTGWQTVDLNAALLQASAAEPKKAKSNHWLWIILLSLCAALIAAAGIATWLFTSGQLN